MNIASLAPEFSNMLGNGTTNIYNYINLISGAELMTEQQKKPQMNADERRLITSPYPRLSHIPTGDDEKAVKWALTTNSKRTRTNSDNVSSYRVHTSSVFNPYFFLSGCKHPRNRTRMTLIARIFTDTFYPMGISHGGLEKCFLPDFLQKRSHKQFAGFES